LGAAVPVDTPYAEYDERAPDWRLCRDVRAGPRRVREVGEAYAPMAEGMRGMPDGGRAAYAAFLARADFFNGFGRAVQGLHGMVFRKKMDVSLPPAMADYEQNSTINGRSVHRLGRWLMNEELEVGRVAILTDAPSRRPGAQLSAAQVVRLGLRPYLATYIAEDVLDLRHDMVDNRRALVMARLHEVFAEPDPDDEFAVELRDRYRVLELVPARVAFPDAPEEALGRLSDGRGVVYRQRVFVKTEKGDFEVESFVPRKADGRPWTQIPLVVIDADGEPDDGEICRPPLLDLAHKTLSLYRTLADLEHGAHFVGHPQPCRAGYTKLGQGDEEERIGAGLIWDFTDPAGKAWYMTHDGRGLETLEKLADRKRQEIALLGARMLEPDRKAVEAAATAQIHRQGEVSVLQALALLVSEGLTRALGHVQEWLAAPGEAPRVELNTDYVPTGASPQMVSAMAAAYAAGQVTDQMWYNFLTQGEVVSTDETFEDFVRFMDERRAESSPDVGFGAAADAEELEEVEEAAD
jgi:hypothetical protein